MFRSGSDKHNCARKIISILMVISFLVTFICSDALAAVDTESNFFIPGMISESDGFADLNVDTMTIPSHLGEIRYSFRGDKDKVVIHVQDAHSNRFAQSKIADIIDYLNKEYGLTIVNLEGGAGEYDLSVFTRISGDEIRREVAEYFLDKGEVNGAEFYAINNPEKVRLWGVEDKDLYVANLRVYRNSLSYKKEVDGYLEELTHIFNNLKRHIYNPELLKIDMTYNAYKAGNMDFREYLEFLITKAKQNVVDVKQFNNLYLIAQAMEKEDEVDFKKANTERGLLIDQIKAILSPNEMRELVSKTVQFKTKRISRKEFYNYLLKKARESALDIKDFPALSSYIVYVTLFEAVDRFEVMKELDELEAEIKEPLYENDAQRDLNFLSRNLAITHNMFNFMLTKVDYGYYMNNIDSFNVENFTTFIDRETPKYKVSARPSGSITKLDDYRGKIDKFYEYSFKRDDAFLENMQFESTPGGRETAIIMTGGFHTENLCELFQGQGISYVSIVPKFTSEKEYENPYFNLLAGQTADVQQMLRSAIAQTQVAMLQVLSWTQENREFIDEVYGEGSWDNFEMSIVIMSMLARTPGINIAQVEIAGITVEGENVQIVIRGREEPVVLAMSDVRDELAVEEISEPETAAVVEEPGRFKVIQRGVSGSASYSEKADIYDKEHQGRIDDIEKNPQKYTKKVEDYNAAWEGFKENVKAKILAANKNISAARIDAAIDRLKGKVSRGILNFEKEEGTLKAKEKTNIIVEIDRNMKTMNIAAANLTEGEDTFNYINALIELDEAGIARKESADKIKSAETNEAKESAEKALEEASEKYDAAEETLRYPRTANQWIAYLMQDSHPDVLEELEENPEEILKAQNEFLSKMTPEVSRYIEEVLFNSPEIARNHETMGVLMVVFLPVWNANLDTLLLKTAIVDVIQGFIDEAKMEKVAFGVRRVETPKNIRRLEESIRRGKAVPAPVTPNFARIPVLIAIAVVLFGTTMETMAQGADSGAEVRALAKGVYDVILHSFYAAPFIAIGATIVYRARYKIEERLSRWGAGLREFFSITERQPSLGKPIELPRNPFYVNLALLDNAIEEALRSKGLGQALDMSPIIVRNIQKQMTSRVIKAQLDPNVNNQEITMEWFRNQPIELAPSQEKALGKEGRDAVVGAYIDLVAENYKVAMPGSEAPEGVPVKKAPARKGALSRRAKIASVVIAVIGMTTIMASAQGLDIEVGGGIAERAEMVEKGASAFATFLEWGMYAVGAVSLYKARKAIKYIAFKLLPSMVSPLVDVIRVIYVGVFSKVSELLLPERAAVPEEVINPFTVGNSSALSEAIKKTLQAEGLGNAFGEISGIARQMQTQTNTSFKAKQSTLEEGQQISLEWFMNLPIKLTAAQEKALKTDKGRDAVIATYRDLVAKNYEITIAGTEAPKGVPVKKAPSGVSTTVSRVGKAAAILVALFSMESVASAAQFGAIGPTQAIAILPVFMAVALVSYVAVAGVAVFSARGPISLGISRSSAAANAVSARDKFRLADEAKKTLLDKLEGLFKDRAVEITRDKLENIVNGLEDLIAGQGDKFPGFTSNLDFDFSEKGMDHITEMLIGKKAFKALNASEREELRDSVESDIVRVVAREYQLTQLVDIFSRGAWLDASDQMPEAYRDVFATAKAEEAMNLIAFLENNPELKAAFQQDRLDNMIRRMDQILALAEVEAAEKEIIEATNEIIAKVSSILASSLRESFNKNLTLNAASVGVLINAINRNIENENMREALWGIMASVAINNNAANEEFTKNVIAATFNAPEETRAFLIEQFRLLPGEAEPVAAAVGEAAISDAIKREEAPEKEKREAVEEAITKAEEVPEVEGVEVEASRFMGKIDGEVIVGKITVVDKGDKLEISGKDKDGKIRRATITKATRETVKGKVEVITGDPADIVGMLNSTLDAPNSLTEGPNGEKALIAAFEDVLKDGGITQIVAIEDRDDLFGFFGEDGKLYLSKSLLEKDNLAFMGIIHEAGEKGLIKLPEGYTGNKHTGWRGAGGQVSRARASLEREMGAEVLEGIVVRDGGIDEYIALLEERMTRPVTPSERALMEYNMTQRNRPNPAGKNLLQQIETGMQGHLDPTDKYGFTQSIKDLKDTVRREGKNYHLVEAPNILSESAQQKEGQEMAKDLEEIRIGTVYGQFSGAAGSVIAKLESIKKRMEKEKFPQASVTCLTEGALNEAKKWLEELEASPNEADRALAKRFDIKYDDSYKALGRRADEALPDVVKLIGVNTKILDIKRKKDDFKLTAEDMALDYYLLLSFLSGDRFIDYIEGLDSMTTAQLAGEIDKLLVVGAILRVSGVNWQDIPDYHESMEAVRRSL